MVHLLKKNPIKDFKIIDYRIENQCYKELRLLVHVGIGNSKLDHQVL